MQSFIEQSEIYREMEEMNREMAAELNSHQLCRNQCETLFSSN